MIGFLTTQAVWFSAACIAVGSRWKWTIGLSVKHVRAKPSPASAAHAALKSEACTQDSNGQHDWHDLRVASAMVGFSHWRIEAQSHAPAQCLLSHSLGWQSWRWLCLHLDQDFLLTSNVCRNKSPLDSTSLKLEDTLWYSRPYVTSKEFPSPFNSRSQHSVRGPIPLCKSTGLRIPHPWTICAMVKTWYMGHGHPIIWLSLA